MERIRALLTESGFITEEDLDRLFTGQLSDIYALRTGALTERLTNGELTRVLIHLARRRGFKSNRREQSGDAEVDHIVPYSISFDDRMTNKVLVLTRENRNKGNRLPLQYLQGEARERFAVYTRQNVKNVKNVKKRQNLLKPFLTKAEINAFKERNLQDTKTIARFMYNYINDHLLFAQSATGRKKHVHAVNGAATAYLRKRWASTRSGPTATCTTPATPSSSPAPRTR